MPKVVIAEIKESDGPTWHEPYCVDSEEVAEAQVREVVAWFNRTRKHGVRERVFVRIVSIEEANVPRGTQKDGG